VGESVGLTRREQRVIAVGSGAQLANACHTKGASIFCDKPVAREGGAWCRKHERLVYVTIKELGEAREAA